MSNTQPLPDATPAPKPATALERLVRIETLLLLTYRRITALAWLLVVALLLLAFVLGHVWR